MHRLLVLAFSALVLALLGSVGPAAAGNCWRRTGNMAVLGHGCDSKSRASTDSLNEASDNGSWSDDDDDDADESDDLFFRRRRMPDNWEDRGTDAEFTTCMTPQEESASPLRLDVNSVRVPGGAVYVGQTLQVLANVDLSAAGGLKLGQMHFSLDAGRLGSMAGVNLEVDLCQALVKMHSNVQCPVPAKDYSDMVLTQLHVPSFPGAGSIFRSISVRVAIYEMVNGAYVPGTSRPLACIDAYLPIRR